MIRSELVDKIARRRKLSVIDTGRVIDCTFGAIMKALTQHRSVQLRGFGTFYVRVHNQRLARNPRTGEPVQVSPKVVPRFKAGRPLLSLINKKK